MVHKPIQGPLLERGQDLYIEWVFTFLVRPVMWPRGRGFAGVIKVPNFVKLELLKGGPEVKERQQSLRWPGRGSCPVVES